MTSGQKKVVFHGLNVVVEIAVIDPLHNKYQNIFHL